MKRHAGFLFIAVFSFDGWAAYPQCILHNGAGLPASPSGFFLRQAGSADSEASLDFQNEDCPSRAFLAADGEWRLSRCMQRVHASRQAVAWGSPSQARFSSVCVVVVAVAGSACMNSGVLARRAQRTHQSAQESPLDYPQGHPG
jgi:hypothetical protein